MEKRTNSGSACYDYDCSSSSRSTTALLAAPPPAAAAAAAAPTIKPSFATRINSNGNCSGSGSKPQTAIGGNSSPKLAATFQGMSVNVSMPPTTATFSPRINKQQQAVTTTTFNHKLQHNHISNNNNGNTAPRLQKQTPAAPLEQYAMGNNSSRTKPRNKSEEAISDLLQRIPDIGQIFDVQSRIGNGTFSTVLLATLKREAQLPDGMRRKFAIKHHIPTSHPDRIMKELQCMTDMGGTNNVVGIHCCLRYEASAAFVMPYMPHDRFHDFYTKMDVSEIRLYMQNLLQALRHVHKFNVIHRDVKPSNFLYNRRQGQFLLVDFGLAQHVNVSQQQQLQLQQQHQQPALRGGGSGKAMLSNNSKRPREREINANQQLQLATTTREATLGGAVKRMRLIDDQAVSNWNKMPLKPVNSAIAAQSAKQQQQQHRH